MCTFPWRNVCILYLLISPSKSDIGRISKRTIDKIIPRIKELSYFPLWINSTQVIHWFSELPHKTTTSFILFDIDNYYASITKSVLDKALTYAQTILYIPDSDINSEWKGRRKKREYVFERKIENKVMKIGLSLYIRFSLKFFFFLTWLTALAKILPS